MKTAIQRFSNKLLEKRLRDAAHQRSEKAYKGVIQVVQGGNKVGGIWLQPSLS